MTKLNYRLSDNFYLNEFVVSSDYPEIASDMKLTNQKIITIDLLANKLMQPIRSKYGTIKILSGYRNTELNRLVGGSRSSDHLCASACDFISLNFSNEQVFKWIVRDSNIHYRQVIFYPESSSKFIHISINTPSKKHKKQALIYSNKKYSSFV